MLDIQRHQVGPQRRVRPLACYVYHLLPVGRDHFGGLDLVREGDGPQQRIVLVSGDIAVGQHAFGIGQSVPAAEQLDGIVQIQAGVLFRGQQVAHGFGYLVGFQRQDDHPVVGQPVALDGLGKGHAVEDGPVDRLVVHRIDLQVAVGCPSLGRFSVEARCGGRVEPLVGVDAVLVVHQTEGRDFLFILAFVGGLLHARRAVGLIAYHQIKGRRAFGLGRRHQGQRLVGAEDGRERPRPLGLQACLNLLKVGRDGVVQLQQRGILIVAPGSRIRADAQVAQGQTLLFAPLPHRLGHQRDRRHQVQHPSAQADLLLRNPERDRCFARAAGEDQLAAVMFLESVQHLFHGLFLVGMGRKAFAGLKLQAFRIVHILPPVHVPAFQLRLIQHSTRFGRGLEDLQGVLLNGAAGVDDQPRGEMVGLGRRHEGVDVFFLHSPVGIEELALDGAQAPFLLLRHQVDTDVGTVAVGPLSPQPYLAEAVAEDAGILGQGRLYQPLKRAPHADRVGGVITEVVQSFVEIWHGRQGVLRSALDEVMLCSRPGVTGIAV